MPVSTKLDYESTDNLYLDPQNPRLGRSNTIKDLSQDEVLELMRDWTLDELAISYMQSGGFWTHEALLVIEEEINGENRLVVVEGNRRLAALKILKMVQDGKIESQKWSQILDIGEVPDSLFSRVPYLLAESREEIEAFLGFRHVTGIKEWKPAEKAQFIAKLIDERNLSYRETMRKIGSKTPTVRKHYIAYRLLLQIEDTIEEFTPDMADNRFSVMYLSLRTNGVQSYLSLDINAEPEAAKEPVAKENLDNLSNYSKWIFGTADKTPLFTDSREVDNFGRILESEEAVEYLERSETPKFEIAYKKAGGDEPEIVNLIESAADNVELSLTRVHAHRHSGKIKRAVKRFGEDALQLLNIFPKLKKELQDDQE